MNVRLIGIVIVIALVAPGAGMARAAEAEPRIAWDLAPGDLPGAVKVYDPDRPLMTGYRVVATDGGSDREAAAAETYWYYDGALISVDVAPANAPEGETVRREHPERARAAAEAEAQWSPGRLRAYFAGELIRAAEAIPYRDLLEAPALHRGRAVRYEGRVIQVIDGERWRVSVRIDGTIGAGHVMLVRRADETVPALRPDEPVEFVGIVAGMYHYTSRAGTAVTIPDVTAYRLSRRER